MLRSWQACPVERGLPKSGEGSRPVRPWRSVLSVGSPGERPNRSVPGFTPAPTKPCLTAAPHLNHAKLGRAAILRPSCGCVGACPRDCFGRRRDSWKSPELSLNGSLKTLRESSSARSANCDLAVTALMCGGHMLIEDVPGVGKTMLARAIADVHRAARSSASSSRRTSSRRTSRASPSTTRRRATSSSAKVRSSPRSCSPTK